jgi:hypothetical protein
LSRKAFRLAISAVICLASLCRISRVAVIAAGSTGTGQQGTTCAHSCWLACLPLPWPAAHASGCMLYQQHPEKILC